MKTLIKIFYPNQNGKIELTKEELESLLDTIRKEAYDEGYADGSKNTIIYNPSSPNVIPSAPTYINKESPAWNPYEITCSNLTITKEEKLKHEITDDDN